MKFKVGQLVKSARGFSYPRLAHPDGTVSGYRRIPASRREAIAVVAAVEPRVADHKGDYVSLYWLDDCSRSCELSHTLMLVQEESEERLPCGHPVTDDPAHNDPNPGATHFCVSCEQEAKNESSI